MNKLIKYYQILKLLGPSWAFFRLKYAWQSRGDFWERKTPQGKWGDKVPFIKGRFWEVKWSSDLSDQAMDIKAGKYRLFFRHEISSALKPDWFAVYFAGKRVGEIPQKNVHWSRISDFSSGDIKGVWELSRFAWAYPLIQAKDSETFWSLLVTPLLRLQSLTRVQKVSKNKRQALHRTRESKPKNQHQHQHQHEHPKSNTCPAVMPFLPRPLPLPIPIPIQPV